MIQTSARVGVFEVTYIPDGWSEPNMIRLDDEDIDAEVAVDEILEHYDKQGVGEVISIIHIRHDNSQHNLYGARRYGL